MLTLIFLNYVSHEIHAFTLGLCLSFHWIILSTGFSYQIHSNWHLAQIPLYMFSCVLGLCSFHSSKSWHIQNGVLCPQNTRFMVYHAATQILELPLSLPLLLLYNIYILLSLPFFLTFPKHFKHQEIWVELNLERTVPSCWSQNLSF